MVSRKTASPGPQYPENWSRTDPKRAAVEVRKMVHTFEGEPSWRHYMALRGASAYSGIGLGELFENISPWDGPQRGRSVWRRRGRSSFAYGGWFTREAEQHARANVETIVEKLMGLREPKTQRVGTDVEWEIRRQGIWADRWSEGCMHQPALPYLDTWDLARQGALLAFAATGKVACRVEPDFVSKTIRNRLRSTLQTFIDPADMGLGRPLAYFDITWENPEYLCEDDRFKPHRDLIWKSSEVPPHHEAGNMDGPTFGTRMVKMVSCWRMPFGSFGGRQCFVFKSGEAVHWEGWEDSVPPLAFYGVNPTLGESFWCENFIEIMLDPLADAADIDDLAKETMRRTSATHISLDGATAAPKGLEKVRDVHIYRYRSSKGQKPPQIDKPGVLHPDFFQWRDRKVAVARELAGVPAMHITSESPQGTDSGRAKRLEASLLPERFARKLRNWDHWVAVDIANLQVRAARQIGKIQPDWQLRWPGADFDANVSVEVLNIDDTAYEVRSYAVSEQKGTPAEQAQYAQELFDRKQITADQLSLILDGIYDTKKETKEVSAQRKLIAKSIDDILHAPAPEVEDERAYLEERFLEPDPWIDPPAAVAQILPLYRQAMLDGVPQNRRSLLKHLLQKVLDIQVANEKAEQQRNASVSAKASMGELAPAMPQIPGGPGMPAAPPGLPQDPAAAGALGAADLGLGAQPMGGPVGLA